MDHWYIVLTHNQMKEVWNFTKLVVWTNICKLCLANMTFTISSFLKCSFYFVSNSSSPVFTVGVVEPYIWYTYAICSLYIYLHTQCISSMYMLMYWCRNNDEKSYILWRKWNTREDETVWILKSQGWFAQGRRKVKMESFSLKQQE